MVGEVQLGGSSKPHLEAYRFQIADITGVAKGLHCKDLEDQRRQDTYILALVVVEVESKDERS